MSTEPLPTVVFYYPTVTQTLREDGQTWDIRVDWTDCQFQDEGWEDVETLNEKQLADAASDLDRWVAALPKHNVANRWTYHR